MTSGTFEAAIEGGQEQRAVGKVEMGTVPATGLQASGDRKALITAKAQAGLGHGRGGRSITGLLTRSQFLTVSSLHQTSLGWQS